MLLLLLFFITRRANDEDFIIVNFAKLVWEFCSCRYVYLGEFSRARARAA